MSTIDRQHEHTVRMEAAALERRAQETSETSSATLLALLAISKRLELVETALRGREA